MNFDDPVATALRVVRLLDRAEIAHALYGGLAVAAWGVPRETKDADVAVVSADVRALVDLLREDGIDAVAAFERVAFGGLLISRATLVAVEPDSGLNTVDLVEPVSRRYGSRAIERAVKAPLRGEEVSLLAPEDVVIFKILSTRERDLEDGAAIVREMGNDIDLAAISAEIRQLAGEISGHNIESRWERCRQRDG